MTPREQFLKYLRLKESQRVYLLNPGSEDEIDFLAMLREIKARMDTGQGWS